MGPLDVMARKVDVLKRHCDEVGRDVNEIEFTLGVKFTLRDSKDEAERVWRAAMEHNRTSMSDVVDDDTFWNGTPEQMAEKLRPYVDLGFRTVISEQPAPYDVETLERREVKPMIERGYRSFRCPTRTASRLRTVGEGPTALGEAGPWTGHRRRLTLQATDAIVRARRTRADAAVADRRVVDGVLGDDIKPGIIEAERSQPMALSDADEEAAQLADARRRSQAPPSH